MDDLPESSIVEGAHACPTEAVELGATVGDAQYNAIEATIELCMTDRGLSTTTGSSSIFGLASTALSIVMVSPDKKAWSEALLGRGEYEGTVTYDSNWDAIPHGPDGCSANRRLAVNPQYFARWVLHRALLDIQGPAIREVQRSARFHNVLNKRRPCYADAGFSPVESVDQYSVGGLAPEYRTTEAFIQDGVAAAVAAATCVRESGFLRTWSGLLALAELLLLEDDPGVLTEYLEVQQNVREDLGA